MSGELALAGFGREQVDLIKRTIARGATDDELSLFLHACKRTGLDPLTRQIYAIKRRQNVDGDWRDVLTFQTGIDGYRLIADRTGRYAPGPRPTFEYDAEGRLVAATAYVRKQTGDGTWHMVEATAHYQEYVARKKDGNPNQMWFEKPHIMLGKCAEAAALRRAFPNELSGVYTQDEMPDSDPVEAAIVQKSLPAPVRISSEQRLKLTALLAETGADVDKFKRHFNLDATQDSLGTLTVEQYQQAMKMLLEKKTKKPAKEDKPQGLSTKEQMKHFRKLIGALAYTPVEVAELVGSFGGDTFEGLSQETADEVLAKLDGEVKEIEDRERQKQETGA